jgi:TrpR family transcriptional regulator, trp operon repressor
MTDAELYINLEKFFIKSRTPARVRDLMYGLFTQGERKEFALRLEIIRRLKKGTAHYKIAKSLGVGVATVTRGSHELRRKRFRYL